MSREKDTPALGKKEFDKDLDEWSTSLGLIMREGGLTTDGMGKEFSLQRKEGLKVNFMKARNMGREYLDLIKEDQWKEVGLKTFQRNVSIFHEMA